MKQAVKKSRLGIRLQEGNRLTMPVLLNQLENSSLPAQLDMDVIQNEPQLQEFISDPRPGLLLYSFMTPHLPAVYREIEGIRRYKNGNLKLVAGGSHTSGDPLSSLQMGFNLAVTGAAEMGLVCLAEAFIRNTLPEIPTILHLPELDRLDRSLPLSRLLPTSPPLEITRGCYWNCKFCQTACRKAIHRSLESVEIYLEALRRKGHHRRINFICPSASEYDAGSSKKNNLSAIEELLQFFREGGTTHLEYGIFPSETRPDRLTAEFLDLIRRYCSNQKITIGAQTGSESLLKQIRRGHTVADIEAACEVCAAKNFQAQVDLILGFPGETRTDRRETLALANRLASHYGARIHMHYFIPLSGTDFADASPTALDYRTIDTIEKMEGDGISTGWWREGRRLSLELVKVRDQLKDKAVTYQEIDWR